MTVKYVFVCAASRSGSTLLDMLLGGHPQLESLGEIDFLGKAVANQEPCSCGKIVTQCHHWQAVFSSVHRELGQDIERNPYGFRTWDTWVDKHYADNRQQTWSYNLARRYRHIQTLAHFNGFNAIFPVPKALREGLNRSFLLYDVVRNTTGTQAIVDSSKHLLKAIAAYQQDPDAVRIILMVRDGRGVLYSRLYSGQATASSPAHAVKLWLRYYARAQRLLSRWVDPAHHYLMRYEDLVQNTETTLANCTRWLGLPFNEAMMENHSRIRHLVGGNEAAKKRFSTQGIRVDERWRNGLTRIELDTFERMAGSLSRKFGYGN
jgi:hypothetical protein